jgi:CheY-like chemotaxis protein
MSPLPPPSKNVKTIYIIRWLKFSKPVYHVGELIRHENSLIPGPAEIYQSLSMILQVFRRKYQIQQLNLVTMGMTNEEFHMVDQFRIANNKQVLSLHNIPRPLGKRDDGSLHRVFMVDQQIAVLKEIRTVLIGEHFEIVGVATNGDRTYDFFSERPLACNILFCGQDLGDCNAYQLIKELKKLNPTLSTIVIAEDRHKIDVALAATLQVNFHLVKPIQKEEMLEKLRLMLSEQ